MALKRYYCRRAPSLRIGASIQFNAGYFQTDNPHLQKIVESNDWYGSIIREIPAPEDVALPATDQTPGTNFSTLPKDAVDFDFDEEVPDPKPKPDAPKPVNELTATDIVTCRKPQVQAWATELGIDIEGKTVSKMRREVRQILGV